MNDNLNENKDDIDNIVCMLISESVNSGERGSLKNNEIVDEGDGGYPKKNENFEMKERSSPEKNKNFNKKQESSENNNESKKIDILPENKGNLESDENVQNHKDSKINEHLGNITLPKDIIEPKNTGSAIDLKYYDNLRTLIKTQENILTMTSVSKEKVKYATEISVDQLKSFKDNSLKYGKYLKNIHDELQMIGDLMRKIKKEIKTEPNSPLK